jgi:hypothetical protein
MTVLHYDSFSLGLNLWRDTAAEFRRDFEDSADFTRVLDIVFNFLNARLTLDGNDQLHPFNRYADADKTGLENFNALKADVMNEIQDSRTRGYAHAFFNSGGTNYEDMLELLDEYLLFADRAEDPDWSETDESDDDSESEAESVIDLTDEDDNEGAGLGAGANPSGA